MSAHVRIACTGFVFDPAAEAIIRGVAPPQFDLTFAQHPEALAGDALAQSEILLTVAPVTGEMLQRAPKLRFIQKWGTGYEKIDTHAAARHGIGVAITAGANADTVAEHAIALMLAVMRRIVVADAAVRAGRWIPSELRPVTRRLFGRTVGIVGFGNIGRAVARQLRGFEATILYYKRGGPVDDEAGLGATYAALDELLSRSDIVSLHCPGGAANRRMIDRPRLAAMKPGAVLVNVARGELVAEEDLVDALASGHLAGAGLDVFAEEPLPPGSPLRELPNVVLTPHSAGSPMEDVAIMARHAFGNIEAFLAGRQLRPADVIVPPAR
jgi:phosphoglycerate dehydrogenase-like enzyme